MVKVFTRRAGGEAQAKDVVQSGYETALRYSNSFSRDDQKLGGWINTIVNNAYRKFAQQERLKGMSVEYDEELGDGVCDPDFDSPMYKKLEREINKIKFPLRQVLYLYFFKQYKPREIETVLDLSNSYIRQSICVFKKRISDKYGAMKCDTE